MIFHKVYFTTAARRPSSNKIIEKFDLTGEKNVETFIYFDLLIKMETLWKLQIWL
jgi:hypothetical protein